MRYLLDTNVVTQLTRRSPSADVIRWLASIDEAALAISVITVREILYGVARARRDGAVRVEIYADRIEAVVASYAGRILPIDDGVARVWAAMLARSNKHVDDTPLAATAAVHGLTVVTRNLAHLRGRGVPLLDPFRAPPAT